MGIKDTIRKSSTTEELKRNLRVLENFDSPSRKTVRQCKTIAARRQNELEAQQNKKK